MKRRSLVVFSGLGFSALALFGYEVFGWRTDGWVLAVGGSLHLGSVLAGYPRVDSFLVAFHYLALLVWLTGVGWVLIDIAGPASGVPGILLVLLREDWGDPFTYASLGVYALVVAFVWLSLITTACWVLHRRKPRQHELLTGFFIASLLTIPCHFALADTVSGVAVLNPEESGAFVFAVGLESLDFPLIVHVIVGIGLASALKKGRSPQELS